jgi:putative FmdB family regulatory protein
MPLYELTCQKCGHQFEELLTLAQLEAGAVACPKCGESRVTRGLSTFATTSSTGKAAPPCGFSGGCGSSGFS